MAAKYELKKTKTGFVFNLKAPNGKVILSSEVYPEKRAALGGIASVVKNSPNEPRCDLRKSKRSEPYFVLTATNGEVIGKSEMYKSLKGARNGIASCIKFGATARTVDLNAE
ncbi:MAG: DUF1508 domain-containing protein [Acidobacteria bacterium]|nr:DUF1508 domain-containing protein [Acidobacteriota bacterium]